jgi:predicted enzyme related to lactoylglutathione lyase
MADDRHHKIDYIEIPTPDVAKSKDFFRKLFDWEFHDYGPDYTSFDDGRMTGGFRSADAAPTIADGSILLVFYAEALEDALPRVRELGGEITKDIFNFPGGRRFHFLDPAGVEYAIWSDDEE